jgi:cobalt-zinc-cadmium efflux system outer membrane protein
MPRMSHFSAAAVFAFIVMGCAGHRADAAGLTLTQLIDIAVENNKELHAARQVEAQARARLLQAGLYPNPRLDTATRNEPTFNFGGEYSASAGISQQFPIAGRIARQKDVARVEIDLALEEIREAELKLAGEVATGFYRILALNRQIAARDQMMAVNRKLLAVTRNRFKAGEVSELDVNTAQLEVQKLDQERVLAANDRSKQLGELNQLLGRSAAQPLAIDDTMPAINVLPNLVAQQRQALERRPELRSAILTARRAGADMGLARAERWEDWTVGLGVERSRIAVDGLPRQVSSNAVALSLSIPLPLLNQNQGKIAEAGSKRTQAEVRIAGLELSIANQVENLLAELARFQQILVQYQRNTLPIGKRNVEIAQQGYSKGQNSIVEVVQAQRQFGELTISYLNTLDQYLQALGKLRTATADYIKPVAPAVGSADGKR